LTRLISIIMPALDEAASIASVIASVPVDKFTSRGLDVEILVVDNGSKDGTGHLARKAGARVVHEPRRGYGQAYLRGFKEAKGDIICTMDADGTYPASVLPDMVEVLLRENLDFINTNRFTLMTNGVMPKINKVGNAILNLTGQALFRLPFRDSQSGMWIFRARLLEKMNLQATDMALSQEIKIEAAYRLKARCAELPVHYGYRSGTPKLRPWHDGVGNLLSLFRKRLCW